MMCAILPSRLGALVAVAFVASTAPAALAAGSHFDRSAIKNEVIASHHPFEPSIPGATDAWCNSLAYPYCDDPAPGAVGLGAVPYADPMPDHPIFGE
jgi:hypothetical protein